MVYAKILTGIGVFYLHYIGILGRWFLRQALSRHGGETMPTAEWGVYAPQ
jgi:hypothetical protein